MFGLIDLVLTSSSFQDNVILLLAPSSGRTTTSDVHDAKGIFFRNSFSKIDKEVYYSLQIFSNQEQLNNDVLTICKILFTPRATLGIIASPRGLVCGPLQITPAVSLINECIFDKKGIKHHSKLLRVTAIHFPGIFNWECHSS